MKYNPLIVAAYFEQQGLPPFVTEHRFAKGVVTYTRKDGREDTRGWAFDFAWLNVRVALEVEGGIWIHGGHSRGSGVSNDHKKFNAANLLGWHILKCEPIKLCRLETVEMIRKMIDYQKELL